MSGNFIRQRMTAKLGEKLGKVGKGEETIIGGKSSKLKILLVPKSILPFLNWLKVSFPCRMLINADVERSHSDNGNTCKKDRVNLMPETLIGLRCMKEYNTRSKGGSHCIIVNDKMTEGMGSAK